MAVANSVDVSIEAVSEYAIQEISLDGQEIYQQPLSLSEHLSKLAQKIDFNVEDANLNKEETAPTPWPWESVRDKLRASLTELNVLEDVLKVAKEKKYAVLDPVVGEPVETKASLQLAGKKAGLQSAATILQNGAERLKQSQLEISGNRKGGTDFHSELRRLREHWRLKKVGNVILGDLSFKSAGSRYWENGTFEVIKSETADGGSCLKVEIPGGLQGVAYIHVSIRDNTAGTDLASVEFQQPSRLPIPAQDWARQLEAAQNVLFCKEVFAQLAKDGVQSDGPLAHVVSGNQIISSLFPGVHLSIALCHSTDRDTKGPPIRAPSNPVLEHSLHQLLRQIYIDVCKHPMPQPSVGLLGASKERAAAGPNGSTADDLKNMSHSDTMLDQIIRQARHVLLRQNVLRAVDDLALELKDPSLTVHCSSVSCALRCTIWVYVASLGYDVWRTSVALVIGDTWIRAIFKDGRRLKLDADTQPVVDLLRNLISASRSLCVRVTPSTGNRVQLQRMRSAKPHSNGVGDDDTDDEITLDPKWDAIGGDWEDVDVASLPGKSFVHKVELLMACLTKPKRRTSQSSSGDKVSDAKV